MPDATIARIAMLAMAALAALAAGARAARPVASPGSPGFPLALVATAGTLGLVAVGAFAPAAPWVRAASLVIATTWLAKTAALGRARVAPGLARGLAYLALYPGLDPDLAFVADPRVDRRAAGIAVLLGLLEVVGAFAWAVAADRLGLLDGPAHVAAWARAGSFVLLIDGGFRTTANAVRALGFHAEDLSRSPWLASSLAEFWGVRWNRFVARPLALEVYGPVKRRAGRVPAVVGVFLVSGVLHEAQFTLAAPGPVGFFTVFFLLQGVGVVVEAALLPRGTAPALRRAFAWAVLLASAPLFFGGTFPAVLPIERAFTSP